MSAAGDDTIVSAAGLEACIGKTPGAMNLKVVDHLDAGARKWLAASPLMFAAFASQDDIVIRLGGGVRDFVHVVSEGRLRIPTMMIDDLVSVHVGDGFGSLFLIPTIGETLRVNGRVAAIDGEAVEIAIEECYIHCAKALIRSEFWKAQPGADVPQDVTTFLGACRFIALATADAQQHADVSPKGDPAGRLLRCEDKAAVFADRPGNRRADSFRHILTRPRVRIVALIPGAHRVAYFSGDASLSTNDRVRESFTVQAKMPLLTARIGMDRIDIVDSPILARARLWPAAAPGEPIDPAAILVGHVKLSKERGIQASLVRSAVSVPGIMRKGLQHDYKTNLY